VSSAPRVVKTPTELRSITGSIGFVATMGALHDGHRSLIERAAAENDEVVVSIFVNPTQFTDPADLARYPRDLDVDARFAMDAGATIVYAPDVATVYPARFSTSVHVRGLTERWEGVSRPGHFDGVATVVSILLNHIRPDRSYFGEKDFQQVSMLRRMHRDLGLSGSIICCPTVREADGLAMSSRNRRLSKANRVSVRLLSHTLFSLRDLVTDGMLDTADLLEAGNEFLSPGEGVVPVVLDYLAIVDPETLVPVTTIVEGSRALVAARVGDVRLIDTLDLNPPLDTSA
jgi:pantoate--beta-alanine ligase